MADKMLTRDMVLYPRDENGELIAQLVPVVIDPDDEEQKSFEGMKISITPMARGEVKKLITNINVDDSDRDKDNDADLVVKHCLSPKFTREELVDAARGKLVSIIVNTILFESGIKISNKKTKKEMIEETEDDFGKN